jgi:Spy/CpxP family protein refolding chaperone
MNSGNNNTIKEKTMKSRMTYMVAGILTLLVFSAGSVFAFGSCLSRVDMIKGITLTDAQKTKLQAMDTDHKKKMIKLHSDMATANVEKDALLKDKNFKKDAVEKQIRKIMAIRTDIEMEKLSTVNDLRTVLTDDQWKIFADHMGSMAMCGKGGMMGMGMMCERDGGPSMCGKGKHGGRGMGMGMGMKHCPMMNSGD